jgi:Tripartite tricarboxylate transporter TctB family
LLKRAVLFQNPVERIKSAIMVKSPQDFVAGLVLIAIGAIAWLATLNLPFTMPDGVGSGMLPKSTAIILAGLGIMVSFGAVFTNGEQLTRWSLREIALVLGGVVLFALTIRGFALPIAGINVPALGLAVAGPLLMITASRADRSTRFVESVVFAVSLTLACIVLFRFILRLPIPVFPPLLGY